jgi:hypothetical protein
MVVYACTHQASGTTGSALRVDGGVLGSIEAAREQRRVPRIGWQLSAGADQQHVYGLMQARKLAFIVHYETVMAGD